MDDIENDNYHYKWGYEDGYAAAYNAGYADALEDRANMIKDADKFFMTISGEKE